MSQKGPTGHDSDSPTSGGASSLSSPTESEIREELQAVLLSPEFASTERGRTLLSYIVECRLNGGLERLKERTIGVDVFGRNVSYDTGQDAIVRVSANSVRKRLSAHYERLAAEGRPPGISILIPPGSYVPEFPEVREKQTPTEPAAAPLPAPPAPVERGLRPWIVLAIVLILSALCAYLALENRRLLSTRKDAKGLTVLPWSAITSQSDARIVLTDANFTLHRFYVKRKMSLAEYVSQQWLQDLREKAPNVPPLTDIQYTSVASARTAAHLSSLLQNAGCEAFIYGGRALQLSDFKEERPMILLGTAPSNPWVELFSDQLNFVPDVLLNQPVQHLKNRSPQPGEPSEYVTSPYTVSPATAYALIALLPNLGKKGPVLILAGTSAEATEAAGEHAVDLPRLTEDLRKRGIDPYSHPKQLELLIKVVSINHAPRQWELVAHRITP